MCENRYIFLLNIYLVTKEEQDCTKFERLMYTSHTITKETELALPNAVTTHPERIVGKVDMRLHFMCIYLSLTFHSKSAYDKYCEVLQKEGWNKID